MNFRQIAKIAKKVFCLPTVPTLMIAIPSFGLVTYVLVNGLENQAVSYIAYLLSAYALTISVTGMVRVIRQVKKGLDSSPLVKKLLGIPFVRNYLKEAAFRAEASLYQGVFINGLYAGIKLFSGIYYRSLWFISLSVYYILLAVMRLSLLRYVRRRGRDGKDKVSELRRYRFSGIILLFMNQALIVIIVLVVHQNSGFEYPGMLIYAMAAYTFYAVIMAVRNVVKFRKYGSPVMSAAKVISLTAALVSMLSLETAMLTQFGAAEDAAFRQNTTALTGGGVSVIVVGMAVYMIVHATKQLRKLNGKYREGGTVYG